MDIRIKKWTGSGRVNKHVYFPKVRELLGFWRIMMHEVDQVDLILSLHACA